MHLVSDNNLKQRLSDEGLCPLHNAISVSDKNIDSICRYSYTTSETFGRLVGGGSSWLEKEKTVLLVVDWRTALKVRLSSIIYYYISQSIQYHQLQGQWLISRSCQ